MDLQSNIKINPFLKWAGGKRWLINNYSEFLPVSFNRYFEPFLGSGVVFFYLKPKKAYLSDINKDLIITYNQIKLNYREVYKKLLVHAKKHSTEYYYDIRKKEYKSESDIAARLIYLNRACFNGIYRENSKGKFNVPIGNKHGELNEIKKRDDNFEGCSRLLTNATVSNISFEQVFKRAKKDDFIYVDPPYIHKDLTGKFAHYNGNRFSWEDEEKLANCMLEAHKKGVKLLMSNVATDDIKNLYSKKIFNIVELDRTTSIAGKEKFCGKYPEMIITNYKESFLF